MGIMSKSKSDKLIKVNNLLDAALEGKVENLPELKQAKKLLTKVLEGKTLETQGEYKVENHRDIKDKQLEIITHYGMENQLGQLVEECAEVIQVVCKWGRYNKSEVSIDILYSLIEELGDIKNIIEQLELDSEFIKEGIQRNIISKVDRELERISKKENNLNYNYHKSIVGNQQIKDIPNGKLEEYQVIETIKEVKQTISILQDTKMREKELGCGPDLDMQIESEMTKLKALEKQAAKKATEHQVKDEIKIGNAIFGRNTKVYKCICDKLIGYKDTYCRHCGQKLNWNL